MQTDITNVLSKLAKLSKTTIFILSYLSKGLSAAIYNKKSFLSGMYNLLQNILLFSVRSSKHFLSYSSVSLLSGSLMVQWVVGSILHGVDPLSYFSFQPVLHDWYNKGRGMCYPVCGMVHIKEPLLLIGKSSLCGGSGFPFSLSEWSLTICLTPYNRR